MSSTSPTPRASGSVSSAALTPLLDTLFLLLFALLALAAPKRAEAQATHEEVRVQLPTVESGPETERSANALEALAFDVEIDGDSAVFVGGTLVADRAALDALLRETLGERLPEELGVTLRTDREAKHGVAVELLQYFRVRGVVDVELIALGGSAVASPFGGEDE
ncbi:MAG: biopolymer transporter ExbD [Planctomycetota bacterium]